MVPLDGVGSVASYNRSGLYDVQLEKKLETQEASDTNLKSQEVAPTVSVTVSNQG